MKKRQKNNRLQLIALTVMLAVSLAIMFAAFTNDVADAKPPGPQPMGWWYRLRCTGCLWDAQTHCPPPDK